MSDTTDETAVAVAVAVTTTEATANIKKSKKVAKAKEEKPKEEKPKVEKHGGFKVPPKSGRVKSTKWCYHVYDIIKEAAPALLQREDVKNAYNSVIDCCLKYEGKLDTWIPTKYYRYINGIKVDDKSYGYFKGLCIRFLNEYGHLTPEVKAEFKTISDDILKEYRILYDLIKKDVVNYMEIKNHESKSKKDIEYYHNQMEKLERDIKAWESAIVNARKSIGDYAKRCIELQKPPVLTKFD
jgi:hypothetical protein